MIISSLGEEILAEKQAIQEEERILNRKKIELYIKQLYDFFRDERPIDFDAAAIAGISADLGNVIARCESAARALPPAMFVDNENDE